MDLKLRKRITSKLPRYDGGTSPLLPGVTDDPVFKALNPEEELPTPIDGGLATPGDVFVDGVMRKRKLSVKPSTSGLFNINPNKDGSYSVNPGMALKIASVVGGVTSIASGIIGQHAQVSSTNEIMLNAGLSQMSVGGVGYTQQNDITGDREMSGLNTSGITNTLSSTAAGASAGAVFGPWGAAIGGVVGLAGGLIGWGTSKSKLRKRIHNALMISQRKNASARAGAMSTALLNEYYSQNGGLTGGTLYANKGKDKWQRI